MKKTGGQSKKNPRFTRTGALNMRVTPYVKEQIVLAAMRNNRSYAAEVAARLEWSIGRYHGDRKAMAVSDMRLIGADDALVVLQAAQGGSQ